MDLGNITHIRAIGTLSANIIATEVGWLTKTLDVVYVNMYSVMRVDYCGLSVQFCGKVTCDSWTGACLGCGVEVAFKQRIFLIRLWRKLPSLSNGGGGSGHFALRFDSNKIAL